jgi:arylsulfatase A-like enzyme
MVRERLARLLTLAATGSVFTAHGAAEAERPNIIFLLADDLGWTDVTSFNSSYYETPNLDRLCRQGMKFTEAYSAAPNCAPSRACIITGQYVPRHGVYTVDGRNRFDNLGSPWQDRLLLAPENAQGIGTNRETIGTAIQKAGYRTGFFGKWHVGWGGPLPLVAHPEEVRGFDTYMLCAVPKHYNASVWQEAATHLPSDIYLSDYLADHAIQFLEENKDGPFFLFFADLLVHVPPEAPETLVQKYKNKPTPGRQKDPVYAAMVESLDHSFGRILAKLDELGLTENTLVVFTSDNGGDTRTSNFPLRGIKGMLYEGGIRVPAIARWPGHIEPGSSSDVPVCGIDMFPTFAAVAGSPVNKESCLLDGQNLVPLFEGRNDALQGRNLFWYMPGYLPNRQAPAAVIRSGDYKLIHFFEDDHIELYNLRKDIGETTNLAAELPEITQKLKTKLDAWRDQTGAQIPPVNSEPKDGIMPVIKFD